MARKANHKRGNSNKGKANRKGDLEILDENPKHVAYPNPPGFKYVEATVTYDDGEEKTGIHLISLDQIARIKASK
jgi:hypothetical protein